MENIECNRPRRMKRIERIFNWTAIAVTSIVLVDIASYELTAIISKTHGHIRGVDYVLLVLAAAFIGIALFRLPLVEKLSVSIVFLVFLWMALELVIGVVQIGQGLSPWHVWPPNYKAVLEPHGLIGVSERGEFTTNSVGIRGSEISDDDRFRILCVGGSTTECLYLDDSKTWPALLGELLSAPESAVGRVWVGNVGYSGHVAVDHRIVLAKLVEARMVDAWVVMCGLNDFRHRLRGSYDDSPEVVFDRSFRYRRPGLSSSLRRPFHRNLWVIDMLERLRKRTKLSIAGHAGSVYQDIHAVWIEEKRRARQESGSVTDQLPDLTPWLDSYEQQLMGMIRLARRRGKLLLFTTQPTIWDANMPEENKSLCIASQGPDGSYIEFGELAEGMKQFNQRMMDVCRREGVECVDLASLLPRSPQVFYDDCHFNEPGAQKVADELARVLVPMIDGKSPKRQSDSLTE